MHYNRVVLVSAPNRDAARSKVDQFLEPFGDGKEWDWYQVGGRWSWDKRLDEIGMIISRPYKVKGVGKSTCRIYKHDNEFTASDLAKCEKILGIKLKPNASPIDVEYLGHSLADMGHADVVNATSKVFWTKLKYWSSPKLLADWMAEEEKCMAYWVDKEKVEGSHGLSMVGWYKKHIKAMRSHKRWTKELPFWNITNKCIKASVADIRKEPDQWWLVNLDLHN